MKLDVKLVGVFLAIFQVKVDGSNDGCNGTLFFVGRCRSPWEGYGNSCYLFGNQTTTFKNAITYCSDQGADVVQFHTVPELNYLKNRMTLNGNSSNYWNAVFQWGQTDGSENWFYGGNITTDVKDWSPGAPNRTNERCTVFMGAWDWKWNDVNCDSHAYPICKRSNASMIP